MASIARESMGYATSMFNLLRNLGGSIGIAFATTYLARQTQVHHSVLVSHVNALNPAAQTVVGAIAGSLEAGGTDPVTAMRRAYGAVEGMVMRQATMLSFLDTFRFMAVVFALLLPLLLLLRSAKGGKGDVAAH